MSPEEPPLPMTRRHLRPARRRFAIVAPLVAALVGCFGSSDPDVSAPGEVRYAFVLLGPDGQAVARAITAAAT